MGWFSFFNGLKKNCRKFCFEGKKHLYWGWWYQHHGHIYGGLVAIKLRCWASASFKVTYVINKSGIVYWVLCEKIKNISKMEGSYTVHRPFCLYLKASSHSLPTRLLIRTKSGLCFFHLGWLIIKIRTRSFSFISMI